MPDAIMASLHSYKSLATRKQLQITLEVPSEYAAQALKMLGVGDPSGSQWFAVTRMNAQPKNGHPAGESPAALPPHADKAEGQDKPRTYTRSQRAAIMCQDPAFQSWIIGRDVGTNSVVSTLGDDRTAADFAIKSVLGITSKRELDTDPEAAARFDAIRTDFELRDLVR